MNKKGLEFGFSWLFAILVGIVIIFIAIYATTKLIGSERRVSDTFIAAELSNLLNPVETNLEESKYVEIDFTDETRIFNECEESGNFGKQMVSASSKIGLGEEWGEKSVRKTVFNKYIFSDDVEQGKKLRVFVKPFEMPFKIADLLFIYEEDYCFVNPISEVEEEINEISGNGDRDIGLKIVEDEEECQDRVKTVCFDELGCDIVITTGSRVVRKDGKDLFYQGPLIYGAIFADPDIYECQLKRLMKRSSELAYLYASKSRYTEGKGCSNNLEADLLYLADKMRINNSAQFASEVVPLANDIGEKNERIAKCKVF